MKNLPVLYTTSVILGVLVSLVLYPIFAIREELKMSAKDCSKIYTKVELFGGEEFYVSKDFYWELMEKSGAK